MECKFINLENAKEKIRKETEILKEQNHAIIMNDTLNRPGLRERIQQALKSTAITIFGTPPKAESCFVRQLLVY